MTSIASQALSHLLSIGVAVGEGLSQTELRSAESRFGFQFGDDHREFLSMAMPMGDRWVNWRTDPKVDLRRRLNWPVEGALFDVSNSEFWVGSWGARPAKTSKAVRVARRQLAAWPKLVPLYGHRYMAAASAISVGVVFSVHQTDVIFYGEDLLDYVKHEFGPADASRRGNSGIPSTVLPPWSLLAGGVEVK